MAGGKGGRAETSSPRIRPLDRQRFQAPDAAGFAPVSLKRHGGKTRRKLAGNRRKTPDAMDPMHFVQVDGSCCNAVRIETTQGDRMEIGVSFPSEQRLADLLDVAAYTPSFDLNARSCCGPALRLRTRSVDDQAARLLRKSRYWDDILESFT